MIDKIEQGKKVRTHSDASGGSKQMTIEMPETRNVAKVPSTDLVMPFKTRGLSYTLEVNISSPLRGVGSSSYFSTLGPSFSGMATHPSNI